MEARSHRIAVLAAGAVVVAMWAIALRFRLVDPAPGALDLGWDAFAGAARGSAAQAVALGFAVIGTGWPTALLTAAVALLIGVRRGWWWALLVVVASVVSELDVLGLKVTAMRMRPDAAFGVATSFPSGHTANAALIGVLVILLVRHLAVRIPVAAYVVAMAWSRTALHAHWLTDVLGGLAIGAATAVLLHALWTWGARRREVPIGVVERRRRR